MLWNHPAIKKADHAHGDCSGFPVLAILVPGRGLNPATLPLFFRPPEGAALILIEYQGPRPEHGAFSSPENMLIEQAARRSANLVREGMLLEKDQVYIVPAGLYPEVRGDRFVLLNYPFRECDSYLADFILSGLANSFRKQLTVILTDQTGLLGADVVRREGGYVYFLEEPPFRIPAVAVPPVDGLVRLEKIGSLLTGDRFRSTNDGLETGKAGHNGKPAAKDKFTTLLKQEVFPLLMKDRQERGPIRLWIAANPNALTAYSIAIYLHEYLRQRKLFTRIRIFATGLNRGEVNQARLGLFDGETLSSFDTTLREQYFVRREDGRYQVLPGLQQNCVFATHHFIANPPFSHCDLVICADPLHLLTDMQRKKLFETFHYAINPGGCLMLPGQADAALPPSTLFAPVDTAPGVFIRRSDVPPAALAAIPHQTCSDAEKEVEKIFLSGYVPAALLVDDELRVIRFYGVLSPYLRRQQDRPSLQLLKIVRDELLFDLSELLERVGRTRQAAAIDSVWLGDELRPECRLEVVPIPGTPKSHKLIIIREKDGAAIRKNGRTPGTKADDRDKRIRTLEKQVQRLRYQLQAAHHLFRQNQQNLQSTNEEVVASNEELQSVNEEFHSINEDLQLRNKDLELQAFQSRSVISAIHRPLLVIQDNGRVHIANQAFLELFGLSRKAIEGHPWLAAAGAMFDLPELKEKLQSLSHADVVDFELTHRFPGLDEKTLAFSANRIKGDEEAGGGILLMVEDVTDRREAERFKDEFIGIASHELRTPATSIKAYTQLLRRELTGSDKREPERIAEHLSRQVDCLTDLAKDLLDITKASAGQLSLQRNYFPVDRLVAEVIEDLQPTTTAKLVLNDMPALPEIWGDRERIRQVLVNLLSNAIKFSPGQAEINVRCGIVKKNFQLTVQDFGIGMSTSTLQRLFHRYYRGEDSAEAGAPGMGLGLYIAAEIVRRHGGSIMVNSEKDKGSTFTVQIPVDRKSA